MPWDPDRYLRFADHRFRPGVELMARVPDIIAGKIVDLGCGTGGLTALLAQRWPDAEVIGIDSSIEMIERARRNHPRITWVVGDVATWEPEETIDLIFSNAALHWLDDHETLFRRLRSALGDGGVLAVQMPDNWNAPTHRIPARILDEADRPETVAATLIRDRLSAPADYTRWVQPADVDLWCTTYYQQLSGKDPVWEWVTGSVLRPVLAALNPGDRNYFANLCRTRYREAYPANAEGVTTLPFSRLFMVATATGTGY